MRNYAGATATTTQPAAHLLAYAKFALRIRRVWRKVVAALLSMPHANNATTSPPPTPPSLFCRVNNSLANTYFMLAQIVASCAVNQHCILITRTVTRAELQRGSPASCVLATLAGSGSFCGSSSKINKKM